MYLLILIISFRMYCLFFDTEKVSQSVLTGLNNIEAIWYLFNYKYLCQSHRNLFLYWKISFVVEKNTNDGISTTKIQNNNIISCLHILFKLKTFTELLVIKSMQCLNVSSNIVTIIVYTNSYKL